MVFCEASTPQLFSNSDLNHWLKANYSDDYEEAFTKVQQAKALSRSKQAKTAAVHFQHLLRQEADEIRKTIADLKQGKTNVWTKQVSDPAQLQELSDRFSEIKEVYNLLETAQMSLAITTYGFWGRMKDAFNKGHGKIGGGKTAKEYLKSGLQTVRRDTKAGLGNITKTVKSMSDLSKYGPKDNPDFDRDVERMTGKWDQIKRRY